MPTRCACMTTGTSARANSRIASSARLKVQNDATRNHDIVLAASLERSTEIGIAYSVVVAKFPTQADGEQYFNRCTNINSGAKLRRTRALVA